MSTLNTSKVIDREKTNILTIFEKNGIRYVRYEFNNEIKELEEDKMLEIIDKYDMIYRRYKDPYNNEYIITQPLYQTYEPKPSPWVKYGYTGRPNEFIVFEKDGVRYVKQEINGEWKEKEEAKIRKFFKENNIRYAIYKYPDGSEYIMANEDDLLRTFEEKGWVKKEPKERIQWLNRKPGLEGLLQIGKINVDTKEEFDNLVKRIRNSKWEIHEVEENPITKERRFRITCPVCNRNVKWFVSELWFGLTHKHYFKCFACNSWIPIEIFWESMKYVKTRWLDDDTDPDGVWI